MGKSLSRFHKKGSSIHKAKNYCSEPDLSQPTTSARPSRGRHKDTSVRPKELFYSEPNLKDRFLGEEAEGCLEIENDYKGDSPEKNIHQKLIVAAIDIGTTYSGYAFMTKSDFAQNRSNIFCPIWSSELGQSYKAPTTILFAPDRTFYKFGFDAETFYHDNEASDYFLFKNFKMLLYDKRNELCKDILLYDIQGTKSMKAIDVFASAIKFFKDLLLEKIQTIYGSKSAVSNNDIFWVITVPAIWDMRAKQFMRDAAKIAGISSDQLRLALEPEAASLYCRQVPLDITISGKTKTVDVLNAGCSYIVLDQGGGTIDITVHEITKNNSLKEVYQANGGNWGGNNVNQQFEHFLSSLFGQNVIDKVKQDSPSAYVDVMNTFELKKKALQAGPENRNVLIIISPKFQETYREINKTDFNTTKEFQHGKLKLPSEQFEQFFKQSIDNIISHIVKLLENPNLANVNTILAVGGYSESSLLMNKLRCNFPDITFINPKDAGLAVLKGAVLFGFEPFVVTTRISRYTYGIKVEKETFNNSFRKFRRDARSGKKYATDVFEKLVSIGDEIHVGELQPPTEYEPLNKGQKKASIEFYASENKNPVHVTDEGCVKLGTLEVDLRGGGENEDYLSLQINAGETEITAEVTNKRTGKKFNAHFCLP